MESDVYRRDPPESMPLSVVELDGRYWREYLTLEEEERTGQVTVMEESSASRRRIPLSIVVSYGGNSMQAQLFSGEGVKESSLQEGK